MNLIYNGKLPNLNDMIGAMNKNRFVGAKLKKDYTEAAAMNFRIQAKGKSFKGHVNVAIHCYEGDLRRDDDNVLSSACKILLDALQVAGIIKNDSPKYCHVKPERFQSQDGSFYTIVEIKEDGNNEDQGKKTKRKRKDSKSE